VLCKLQQRDAPQVADAVAINITADLVRIQHLFRGDMSVYDDADIVDLRRHFAAHHTLMPLSVQPRTTAVISGQKKLRSILLET
jgi:hypothetical protein